MSGVVFGTYCLLGRLNRGGMAEVFLARSRNPKTTHHLLALKRMLPRLRGNDELADMFRDEATIARSLTHPNVCGVLDSGEIYSQHFLVMDFVHGKDLRVVTRRLDTKYERMSDALVAYVVSQIADGLHHAHEQRDAQGRPREIVHRDMSPHNILISYEGVPKVIDFGIAKARDRVTRTETGILKGKVVYMSPEQADGTPLDRRSDIFSLGVVLLELLTGQTSLWSADESMRNRAKARQRDPRSLRQGLPDSLANIITRAMQWNPADRYATAADMSAALRRALAGMRTYADQSTLSHFLRTMFAGSYEAECRKIEAFINAEIPLLERPPNSERGPLLDPLADYETTEHEINAINDAADVAPNTDTIITPQAAAATANRSFVEITHTDIVAADEQATVQMASPFDGPTPWQSQAGAAATPSPSTPPPAPPPAGKTRVLSPAELPTPVGIDLLPPTRAPSPFDPPNDWQEPDLTPTRLNRGLLPKPAQPSPIGGPPAHSPRRGVAPLGDAGGFGRNPPAISKSEWIIVLLATLLGAATVGVVYARYSTPANIEQAP